MAENPPKNMPGLPTGAEPLKKTTGKVAPKKETVRINLPPKPSAAPTIKLPTLPPGGPTGAPSAPPLPSLAARPPAAHAAPAAPRAAAAAPRATTAPAAQRPTPRAAAAPTVGTLDKVLSIVAMVSALIAVGSALYLMFGIQYGS